MAEGGGRHTTVGPEAGGLMELHSQKLVNVGGGDLGGKSFRFRVETADGRSGEASAPTPLRDDSLPPEARLQRLVDVMADTIAAAAKDGGIGLSEINAIVSGVPGSRDPKTGLAEMPNAIGKDPDTGMMAEVDIEGALKSKLVSAGLSQGAIVRCLNDCDIASAAEDLGENPKVINGDKDIQPLIKLEKSVFLLLGTGIGGGIATGYGVDEGKTGVMELGHVEVYTNLPKEQFACGCGKNHEGSVCIEAVASTTGQEKITRFLLTEELKKPSSIRDAEGVRNLLEATRVWNQSRMPKVDVHDKETYSRSITAITGILSTSIGSVDDIILDAGTIDQLAIGANPQSGIAAEAMRISGEHFGRYLRNLITGQNPARIVIGGGGGLTFRDTTEETNPFWSSMMAELRGPENDPWNSISRTQIIAVTDTNVNLGIQGSLALANKLLKEN